MSKAARWASAAWLAWTAFIVYGSLLPFDFQPMALDRAWALFRQAPFLALGVESRADWIANGVLYAPLGFLSATLLLRVLGPAARTAAFGLAALWCAALAGGIEFVQLYFPPRTVSLNDLMAECIGSGLGIALSPLLLPWLRQRQTGWAHGGLRQVSLLLPAYVLAYPALCLFPYDLLISQAEFRAKLLSDNWGWWLAGAGPRPVLAALQLALEVGLALPFGWLLARHRTAQRLGWPALAMAGGLLGLGIEAGQWLIASGISQGASVLTRSAGVLLGALLWRECHRSSLQQLAHHVRRQALPILLVHGLLLAVVTGWFVRPWQGLEQAQAQWQALRLMPFYYHYYTTEALALFSLGSVVVMYLPVAVLGWSLRWSTATAAILAGSIGLVMEGSKLFLGGTHPDPTNALIALASVAALIKSLAWLDALPAPTQQPGEPASRAAIQAPRDNGAPDTEPVATVATVATVAADAAVADRSASRSAGWGAATALLAALAWAAWSAQRLPLFALPVLLGLLVCAAAVWQRPALALALVPAALPVLDLAPWTGRFYWDEFDLLCLVCWSVAMFRSPPPPRRGDRWDGLTIAFVALALSLLFGTVRGGWPWHWPNDDSLIGYYGGYNALRIVKGAVVAGCFVCLFRRLAPLANERQRLLATGMNSGLALAVAVIFWERNAFVGWLDFAADYRVSGPFSAMHKGGAYIECYLAVASAFAATTALQARRWATRLASAVLLLAAAYAVMVTYSRNGYAAFAVMLVLVLSLGALRTLPAGRASASTRWPALAVAAALLLGVAGMAWPIVGGPFARERLAQAGRDLSVRQAHWADALAQRDDGWAATLFGMGLGRFPESHFWRSQEPRRAASFQLMREGDQRYLRLGSGAAIYVEQIVDLPRDTDYRVRARLRSNVPGGTLSVTLCQKWLLTSMSCSAVTLVSGPTAGAWQTAEAQLPARTLTAQAWFAYRPLKLSLVTPAQGLAMDIDDVELTAAAGPDRWYFATDVDPPWHIHSLPLALLFDLGWFGLLAWTALVAVALARGAHAAWQGSPTALAALAAVLAFAVSGALNTLIDAPRFLFLLLWLLWLGARGSEQRATAASTATRTAAP